MFLLSEIPLPVAAEIEPITSLLILSLREIRTFTVVSFRIPFGEESVEGGLYTFERDPALDRVSARLSPPPFVECSRRDGTVYSARIGIASEPRRKYDHYILGSHGWMESEISGISLSHPERHQIGRAYRQAYVSSSYSAIHAATREQRMRLENL